MPRRILVSALSALLLLTLVVPAAGAHSAQVSYQYLILGLEEPEQSFDVARSANGDAIQLTGGGIIWTHPKAADGTGTFTHMLGSTVVGSGTWWATELISFQFYGCGVAGGQPLPPDLCGGKAQIRVHLQPTGTSLVFDGILTVDCVLGSHVPAGADEGVRLVVPGVTNFNREVSGETLFVLQS